MASILKVDTIQDQDGNNIISENANVITIGASGDTITIPSGATLANSGIVTGFQSTGIDDNATSTAITIDSNETSTLQCSAGDSNFALLAYHPTSTGTRTIAKFQSNVGGTQEDKVVIQTSGNVGIGTNSPSSILHLYSNDPQVILDDSGTQSSITGQSGNILYKTSSTNRDHVFFGVSTEVTRITGDGNVGIGTSSPTEKLEVAGNLILDATNSNIKIKSGVGGTTGAVNWTFNTDSTSYASISLPYDTRATTGLLTQTTAGYPITLNAGNGVIFQEDSSETMRIDSSGNVGIGTTSPNGLMSIYGTGRLATFRNASTGTASSDGSYIALNGSDLQIANAESANMIFYTADTERMRIDSSGNVGIGTTAPTQPLQVEGIALSKPKLGLNSFGGSGAPEPNRERARQGLWRASSDRGAWSLSVPNAGIDYSAFSTSTNNSYIVWDLLVTNCSEIVVRMLYANSADTSTRNVISEYSVDGGSTYTTIGTASFGAGSGDCGGTITFGNTSYQNQTYVKIRTAFTSGAPLNSTLRKFIGLKEVFFTPLCSSVSYQKCLG